MSKKSRRRNRRIIKALGALGLGLALANRGKGTETSNVSVGGGKDAAEFKESVVPTKTYQDAIMRGDKGVKAAKSFVPRLSVTEKGEVVRDGVNTGVVNTKSAFVGDKYIYRDGKPYTKGRYGTFAAQKQMERGALPPQLRVPKIKNLYGGSMSGLADGDFAAKKGGRATKS